MNTTLSDIANDEEKNEEERVFVRNYLKASEKRQRNQRGDFQAILGFKCHTRLFFPHSEDLVNSLFNRDYPSVTFISEFHRETV
jgi:hypothetical protein